MTQHGRTPTPTDALAEEYAATLARLSPISATQVGLPGDAPGLDGLAPAGLRPQGDAPLEVPAPPHGVEPTDAVDRLPQLAQPGRLGLERELDRARWYPGQWYQSAGPRP